MDNITKFIDIKYQFEIGTLLLKPRNTITFEIIKKNLFFFFVVLSETKTKRKFLKDFDWKFCFLLQLCN